MLLATTNIGHIVLDVLAIIFFSCLIVAAIYALYSGFNETIYNSNIETKIRRLSFGMSKDKVKCKLKKYSCVEEGNKLIYCNNDDYNYNDYIVKTIFTLTFDKNNCLMDMLMEEVCEKVN